MDREPPERRAQHGFPIAGVFRAALDAVVVMSADGLVRDWNPAAERTFGHPREEALGRELAELIIPAGLRERHREGLRRHVASGHSTILDQRLELTGLRADGSEFPAELTVTRVPETDPPLFAGFVRDLTDAREAAADRVRLARRLEFLADAGSVLDRSLELTETLERLAALPVPMLADLCVIDVLHPSGVIRCAATASRDPTWAEAVREIRHSHPLSPGGAHPVANVLASRRSVLLEEMSSDYLVGIAQDDEHLALMERLRYRSAVVTPLVARGRIHGALSLLRVDDSEPYVEDDLTLAEELGRRAGIALDNARLYEETRHIAVTLQQSLLPRTLPPLPGARLVARYRAASDAQQVGGDFYDAFVIGEDLYGLVIGDVCGKGADAAALTTLARYTIRGAATQDSAPEKVLGALNQAILRDQGSSGRFLTAIFATVAEHGGVLRLRVACGGHPPPLVARATGEVESVPVTGTLLGVTQEIELNPASLTLAPGDAMVLYTDGLSDAGAPQRPLSEGDLAAVLAGAASHAPDTLADLLLEQALSEGPPRDDIALLVLGVDGG